MDVVEGLTIEGIPKTYDLVETATWTKTNGEACSVSYILMDLVQGVELIDFLNQSKQQDDKVVRYIFKELGRILHQLHSANIAHRDLKPENVMITRELKLKVIDLGYGQDLSGSDQSGFAKTRLGTPMYMAPEVEIGKPYQGADADVFAFGTMLFVAKVIAYPWERAVKSDRGYAAISGSKSGN